ncbi:MAG: ABC transporter permease [Zoogloeaceae bacterium]|jgi:ABC-2 type transport system permease protein|nr:ABC transporter permease [Zoogloeaceae bacterium]
MPGNPPLRALPRLAALWKKELLAFARDRHGLAALFIMPLVFILVMSLALAGTGDFSGGRHATIAYAVLDLDETPLSRAFGAQLSPGGLLVKRAAPPDETDARRQVEAGKIAFAVVIPQGFAREIGANRTPSLRLLLDPAVPGALRDGFRQRVEAAAMQVGFAYLLERLETDMMIPGLPQIAGNAAPPNMTLEAVGGDNGKTIALPSAVQQSVPAWLIFSMFFVVVPISAVFIGERQHGTLQRLAAQRVPFSLVLAGKFLPFVLVNQAQAVVMVMAGCWLVPLCGGEALVLPHNAAALAALWLVSLAVSVAAVGWALFIASLARSSEQATVLGGVGNILMGAAGGIMVPRFVMPAAMQPWTRLSPMDWALDGFHRVMLRHGGIADVLPAVLALAGFGLAALVVTVCLHHRART